METISMKEKCMGGCLRGVMVEALGAQTDNVYLSKPVLPVGRILFLFGTQQPQWSTEKQIRFQSNVVKVSRIRESNCNAFLPLKHNAWESGLPTPLVLYFNFGGHCFESELFVVALSSSWIISGLGHDHCLSSHIQFTIRQSSHQPTLRIWDTEIIEKLRGFSPPANYTDRATAACWRS
jgi:hypothetical protein